MRKSGNIITLSDNYNQPRRVWFAKCNYALSADREQFTGMGPYPRKQVLNNSYSMSICTFNPIGLTREEAISEGKKTCIWRGCGERFGGQVWAMAHEIQIDDIVILETDSTDIHAIGTVTGPYRFNRDGFKPNSLELGAHVVPVKWKAVEGKGLMGGGLGDTQILRLVTTERRAKLAARILAATGFPEEIISDKESRQNDGADPTDDELAGTRYEGAVNIHRRNERTRDKPTASRAKEVARLIGGNSIQCEGCDIHIKKALGYEIIDAHHIEPLAGAPKNGRGVSISDFAMLCPNCHRLTHRVLAEGLAEKFDAVNIVRIRHKLPTKKHNALYGKS